MAIPIKSGKHHHQLDRCVLLYLFIIMFIIIIIIIITKNIS